MPRDDKKHKLRKQEWYTRNKAITIKRAKDSRKKRKAWLEAYKTKRSCTLCPEKFIRCLEFHHKDPKTKDGEVAQLIKNGSMARVKAEIKKCVLLCANCHRKVHYEEKSKIIITWQ